jgi:hypothetical protein
MGMNPMNPATQVSVPISVRNVNSGVTRITHSEFYGTIVTSSTAFTLQKDIVVQPGLNVSFPWLSVIAGNFDRYRFTSLELEYIPACPTSTSGTVYMAFDPDALDTGPIQTSDILQYKANVQFSPFLVQRLKLSPELINRKLFTRVAGQNIGFADLKTYDLGFFAVVTDLTASGVALGTLRLNYSIELHDPQPRADGYIGGSAYYNSNSSYSFNSVVYNTIPVIMPSVLLTNNLKVLASGNYTLVVEIPTTATVPTVSVSGSGTLIYSQTGTNSGTCLGYFLVTATGPCTITLDTAGAGNTLVIKTA